MEITGLFIYPIKSLGGIPLGVAQITATGFDYDRYWMLVDENGICITQRDYPILALCSVKLLQDTINIRFEEQELNITKTLEESGQMDCIVWGNSVAAVPELPESSEWFSDLLKTKVYLVRKSAHPKRLVKKHPDAAVNFSDSNQYLIIGEHSLAHLNSKLETAVPMNRFRPNIVFSDGTPHIEDQWHSIRINNSTFEVTKPCARCKLTTINQSTAEVGIEPLRTLSRYRGLEREVLFGQYLKVLGDEKGVVSLGDELQVLEQKISNP